MADGVVALATTDTVDEDGAIFKDDDDAVALVGFPLPVLELLEAATVATPAGAAAGGEIAIGGGVMGFLAKKSSREYCKSMPLCCRRIRSARRAAPLRARSSMTSPAAAAAALIPLTRWPVAGLRGALSLYLDMSNVEASCSGSTMMESPADIYINWSAFSAFIISRGLMEGSCLSVVAAKPLPPLPLLLLGLATVAIPVAAGMLLAPALAAGEGVLFVDVGGLV